MVRYGTVPQCMDRSILMSWKFVYDSMYDKVPVLVYPIYILLYFNSNLLFLLKKIRLALQIFFYTYVAVLLELRLIIP